MCSAISTMRVSITPGYRPRFFERDGRFHVLTDGPDGKLTEYPLVYTFGVTPLQQYLIAFPGGRYQALGIAWDSRAKADAGQRWFHLYPEERITATDPLHWTGPYQRWNSRCAECHSTGLDKGYDRQAQSWNTRWAEISVGCESCHGPGKAHADSARAGGRSALPVDPGRAGRWTFAAGARIAVTCRSIRAGSATRGVRTVPFATPEHRRLPSGHGLSRCARAGAAGYLALFRRWPDPRRGVRVRILPAESHGATRRDLHRLPRGAQRQAACRGQRDMSSMPRAGRIRQHGASSPRTGQHGCAVRQLPYALAHLHGGGSASRPRIPGARSVVERRGGQPRCLYRLSSGSGCTHGRNRSMAAWGLQAHPDTPQRLLARSRRPTVEGVRAGRRLAGDPGAPPMQRATALAELRVMAESDLQLLAGGAAQPRSAVASRCRAGAGRCAARVCPGDGVAAAR